MKDIEVSIVIPAYNEEKYLSFVLQSLTHLQTKKNFEVIVVDNNSSDNTAKLAKSFQDKLNLRVILEKTKGRGAARKRGFDEALGEVVVSLDADATIYPDWLDTITDPLQDGVVATTTSCKIVDCSSLTNALFNFIQPKAMVLYRWVLGHYWLSGFSFGILKSVYQKSGGFDANLQAQEDLDLSFRVANLGKIKFINKPVTFSGRRFKDGLLVGMYDYIRSFIEAFIFKKTSVYLDNPR
ncbi:glycosyltransferase family 2 protein [Candidatus Daviesbacteria bacterium]|nr:glycosyltransferase family 2 protein [Candidatus Daviesbacteria bacterium]